ncbi:MAG: MarC family protein [Treponema sp.]|jgi:multiple antibiotic resistance protein|nr:MarC family protein [Treponema sp.]
MLGDFLRILFTVLLVMDPIGIIPQFLSITAPYNAETRKRIILKAILIAGVVLLAFLLTGKILLDFFGIMPGAFYISGGILFFMIALGMIYSRPSLPRSIPSKKSDPEDAAGAPAAGRGDDADEDGSVSAALFPLAIPLIAGPGLLTVLVMFISHGESWLYSFSLLLPALVISLGVAFITLRCSTLLLKFFGSMGIFIMEKIMGLILAGFAVQFIYDGLLALGIIHP